jgi:hypothetical protein
MTDSTTATLTATLVAALRRLGEAGEPEAASGIRSIAERLESVADRIESS